MKLTNGKIDISFISTVLTSSIYVVILIEFFWSLFVVNVDHFVEDVLGVLKSRIKYEIPFN